MARHFVEFDVILEAEGEDEREAKERALKWFRERIDDFDRSNLGAIKIDDVTGYEDPRALMIGDKVWAVIHGESRAGTIETLSLIASRGPSAHVRLDNGDLYQVHLDDIALGSPRPRDLEKLPVE